MLHNGEWISHVTLGNKYVSGLLVGLVLALCVWRFAWRALCRPPEG